jgi:hypothetical protein
MLRELRYIGVKKLPLGSVEAILRQAFAEQSQKRLLEHSTELFVRKAAGAGLRVNEAQKARFRRWLQKGGGKSFCFRWAGEAGGKKVTVIITARDVRRMLGRVGAQLVSDAEKAAEAAIKAAIPLLRQEFGKTWPAHRRYLARFNKGFEQRLAKRYEIGFELLEMHLTLAREIGEQVNLEARAGKKRGAACVFVDILTRLHARACQIAHEVTVLLRTGYSDGAMARWRSLHEVSIVLQFIAMHGPKTAVRYSDHEAVESLKAARGYNDKAARLKYQPYTDAELAQMSKHTAAIIAKYEPEYDSEYGWAGLALNRRRPNFADIEKAVGLDHFRPYYKFASHNVHANPKGIFYRLGVLGDRGLLPTGATNVGLTDPAQNTAVSIAQATATIAQLTPASIDRWCVVSVINDLVTEVGQAFWKAEQEIQKDEERLR